MLNWVGHDHIAGALCAVGVRGEYVVQRVGMEWVLSAVGHDGLQLLSLPYGGRTFTALPSAQMHANELDRRQLVEMQAGGE